MVEIELRYAGLPYSDTLVRAMTSLSSVKPTFGEALAHPGRCRGTELGVKVSAFVSSKDAQLRFQRLAIQKRVNVRQSVAVRASAPPQGTMISILFA